mmetsp:Transcript_13826/g.44253  ORF Transcript_13826/g.44253 Transcript_13826/m.44253 type:complete len:293 (-) Transcript_13826:69-947(-)
MSDAALSEALVAEDEKARDAFDEYDQDANGSLEPTEVRVLLRKLNLLLIDEQYDKFVADVFEAHDKNADQRISKDEFVALYTHIIRPNLVFGPDLRRACSRGETAIVDDLIRRGCSPNGADGRGWTALHHAAEFGRLETVQLLTDLVGDALNVNAQDTAGWTALMNAAANGHVSVANLLLKMGADLERANDEGRTALHIASLKGHTVVVQALLAAGAKWDASDEGGSTPLHLAALHGRVDVCTVLVAAGADIEAEDLIGQTPEQLLDGEALVAVRAARRDRDLGKAVPAGGD